jgi:hypothetical protein
LDTGSQIGPYLIVGRLGSGGMGDVYRARDQVLDREVAIKTLPPAMKGDRVRLSRFEREARLLASLNHPNIATLHGLEQVGEERFLVMELEGTPLESLIDAGPLPPAEVLRVCRQIAEALEAAHEKGIVHRDLKPSNVIVGPKGRVKVLDFGIAKSIEPQISTVLAGGEPKAANTGLTVPGMVVGTPPYMSPEQVRGLPVDARSDIWSFACLLYEMLSGKRAYHGETWADTLSAILTQEPNWRALPFGVPDSLRGLLRRCLTRDRDRRMAKMAEVVAELDRIAEEGRSGAGSQTGSPPTWVEMPRMSPPTRTRATRIYISRGVDLEEVLVERGDQPVDDPGQGADEMAVLPQHRGRCGRPVSAPWREDFGATGEREGTGGRRFSRRSAGRAAGDRQDGVPRDFQGPDVEGDQRPLQRRVGALEHPLEDLGGGQSQARAQGRIGRGLGDVLLPAPHLESCRETAPATPPGRIEERADPELGPHRLDRQPREGVAEIGVEVVGGDQYC